MMDDAVAGFSRSVQPLSFVDVCAGAGGLAHGLEQAGFVPALLLDKLEIACETLRLNRPEWSVLQADLLDFDPAEYPFTYDVDLVSAGLPRVKATAAVNRARGSEIELELLEAAVMLAHGIQPRALLIENVPDLVTKPSYESIRNFIEAELEHLGYRMCWFVLDAAEFGVPQERKEGFLVAFKGNGISSFEVPAPITGDRPVTVGEALLETMASKGWNGAAEWAHQADRVAPTLVGGSMDRGGADLGPSGTKRAWERMGVYGGSLADELPTAGFRWDPNRGREGLLRLTVDQTAILQGFPSGWKFAGQKTMRYRQIGHATPPPVARVVGTAVRSALTSA
ncbi:DNA cytosine methyltransferase [Nocardia sp. NPDC059246]|uniref:DNA cytosine methyltransferase n=1 Tax=unclassified Nocardia TaxID=2637762 RepID=UPI0036791019